jgi:hypothetical protein
LSINTASAAASPVADSLAAEVGVCGGATGFSHGAAESSQASALTSCAVASAAAPQRKNENETTVIHCLFGMRSRFDALA